MKNPRTTPSEIGYSAAAFVRYQVPFGGDQCKHMTRWAPRVPRADAAPMWPGQDTVRSAILDMTHIDAGAEGLT